MLKKVIVLIITIILSITQYCYASEIYDMGWVEPYYNTAIQHGWITEEISKNELGKNITREDFCVFLTRIIEEKDGDIFINEGKIHFDDVKNNNIFFLQEKDIVYGKEKNLFYPNDIITREEAAVITLRVIEYLNERENSVKNVVYYYDEDDIAVWARDSVCILKDLGVMKGDGYNFSPQRKLNYKEAIKIMVGVYEVGIE